MALAQSKTPVELVDVKRFVLPVAADAVCFLGSIAMLRSGNLTPATQGEGADNTAKAADAANCRVVGIFDEAVTGGAADGDKSAQVRAGAYEINMGAAGDALTTADVGRAVYVIDDETVGKTNPNDTRPVAGVLLEIANGKAVVEIRASISAALTA